MQAYNAYNAGMKKSQYTIRGIPETLDKTLREISKKNGGSLNQTLIDALRRGVGLHEEGAVEYHDMDDLAGTWVADPAFDSAMKSIDRVDEELWK